MTSPAGRARRSSHSRSSSPFRPVRRCRSRSTNCTAPSLAPPTASRCVGRALVALDRVLQVYERHPIDAAAALALRARSAGSPTPGGRRRLGRHPAPLGLLVDRAAPPRLSLRSPGDAQRPAGMERFTIERSDRPGASRPASHRYGTPPGAGRAHDAGVPGYDEAVQRGARLAARRADPRRGDWAVRRPDLAPGGWAFSSRTTTTPTSTTRPRW